METTNRNITLRSALMAGLTATVIGISSITATAVLAPSATAAEIVVAQDVSPARAPLTAIPSSAGSLKIHTTPKAKVSIKAQGKSKPVKTRTVTTNKNGDAVVTGLVAGKKYTLTNGSYRITAVPEAAVLPATSLRVVTTEIPGQLELRWSHQASAAQGTVLYTVTATPLNAGTDRSSLPITAETSANSIVLTDLDLDTRYEFSVTSHNQISAGIPSKAVMTKSLRDLTGAGAPATPAVENVTPEKSPATNVRPAPAPAPAPSGPSTRTIYVCPAGYSEAGDMCEQKLAYTYHTQTETRAYTYHNESYQVTVVDPGPVYPADTAQSQGTPCPWGGSLNQEGDLCIVPGTTRIETHTRSVKDSTPNGFQDNGTEWWRTVQVKDAPPAGFTDNGTQWVKVTAKVAREVAA